MSEPNYARMIEAVNRASMYIRDEHLDAIVPLLEGLEDRRATGDTDSREALAKIEKALDMVSALCKPRGSEGARSWTMSIPARTDYDPDLVISDALASARDALRAAARLRGDSEP